MTNDERNPKPECRRALWCAMAHSSFGFRYAFGFRHSSFGFEDGGSWKALFLFLKRCIGTMNRPVLGVPALAGRSCASRLKAGLQTNLRFMESPLGLGPCIGTMNRCQMTNNK